MQSSSAPADSSPSKSVVGDVESLSPFVEAPTEVCLHSDRLQSALDALKAALESMADADRDEEIAEDDDASDSSESHAADAESAPILEPDKTPNVDEGQNEAPATHDEAQPNADSDEAPPASESHAVGPIISLMHEIVAEHDGQMPPLRAVHRVEDHYAAVMARKRRLEAAEQHMRSVVPTLQQSMSQAVVAPVAAPTITIATPRTMKRMEILRRRQWLAILDDGHVLTCLESGLDPRDPSNRKQKKKWFEGKPLYSAAVLMLAQVTQSQVQAMTKKHKRNKNALGSGSGGDLKGGSSQSMSLDPPLVEAYHPMPALVAGGYFDNGYFPLCYRDMVTPPQIVELLQNAELFSKGLASGAGRFGSMASMRIKSTRRLSLSDLPPAAANASPSPMWSSKSFDPEAEKLLCNRRNCAVISTLDAACVFTVFPQTPALKIMKPKNPAMPSFRQSLSRCKAVERPKFALTWMDHWTHFLANEERRYQSPRALATMYQALAKMHPNGTDCRLWVVKRIIRWILKAKRALQRFTVLRCRLLYSARRPQRDLPMLLVPSELASRPLTRECAADTPVPDAAPVKPLSDASENPPQPVESEEGQQKPSSSDAGADADDSELPIDPLPIPSSGGVILVRSSARVELLTGGPLALPTPPTGDELQSDDAKEDFKKQVQERIAHEVEMNVVVVPTFDPLTGSGGAPQQHENGGVAAEEEHTRSTAPDSFLELLTGELCEIMVELEQEFRTRKGQFDDLTEDVYRDILRTREENGGQIMARKKKVLGKQDGIQLGLIKSAVAQEAQERANPLGGAITAAVRRFHRFVVRRVIIAPVATKKGPGEGGDTTAKNASSSKTGGGVGGGSSPCAPGIVSIREVIAQAFRDSYHLDPKWHESHRDDAHGQKQKKGAGKGAGSSNHPSAATAAAAPSPAKDDDDSAAMKSFLLPILKLDPVASNNATRSHLPYRLFQVLHVDFLENLHTFDDASLFNLRRRERCSTKVELVEDIMELFQRLVEILQNVDGGGNVNSAASSWGGSTATASDASLKSSRAAAARRAKRAHNHLSGGDKPKPEAAPSGLGPDAKNGSQDLVPKKQFGMVLRVLIDRLVRRLLVTVTQLMRLSLSDGRVVVPPLLPRVQHLTLETAKLGAKLAPSAPASRKGSAVSSVNHRVTNVNFVSEPTVSSTEPLFSRLSETAAAANGSTRSKPSPEHSFCGFFHGWRWFAEHPHTVERIWGPGKDLDSDRDHIHDQLVAELRAKERGPLALYTAFQDEATRSAGNPVATDPSDAGSNIRMLSMSLDANLQSCCPIAVGECCDLDSEDLDMISALFPTVELPPPPPPSSAEVPSSKGTTNVSSPDKSDRRASRGLGNFLFENQNVLSQQQQQQRPAKVSNFVGETQFLFTVLHILDMCEVCMEAVPALEIDGAAHLREMSFGSSKKGAGSPKRNVAVPRGNRGGSVTTATNGKHRVEGQHTVDENMDVRDSLFFHWRLRFRIQHTPYMADVRQTMATLFEKHLARDLIVDVLATLKALLRRYFAYHEEMEALSNITDERARVRRLQENHTDDAHVTSNDDVVTSDEAFLRDEAEKTASLLRQFAVQRELGLADDIDRDLYITAALSRLRVAAQRFTGEEKHLIDGVTELLENQPPTEKECFVLVEHVFQKEFEVWDAHRALAVSGPPPSTPPLLSPAAGSVTSGFDSRVPSTAGSIAFPAFTSPRSTITGHGSAFASAANESMASIPIIRKPGESVTSLNQSVPTVGVPASPTVVDAPKKQHPTGIVRCERCHQVSTSQMYCHRNQPKKVAVPVTEAELDGDIDVPNNSRAVSLSAHGASVTSISPSVSRNASVTTPVSLAAGTATFAATPQGTQPLTRTPRSTGLTKIITVFEDVLVCADCVPEYLAQHLIKKLIDVMHAVRAAEAAESAAVAAAAAEKMKKKIQEELFGIHLSGGGDEHLAAEIFDQVHEELKKREEENRKRLAKKAAGDGDDESDDDEGDDGLDDDDDDGNKSLFGRRQKTKKRKKKQRAGDDDDLLTVSATTAKDKKKRRNILEEKLAAVMVGVQREQLAFDEKKSRQSIFKDAIEAFNDLQLDVARALYVDEHGRDPDSLDDLLEHRGLKLEAVVETADEAQSNAILEQKQAEAERLMALARQQSQSGLSGFRKAAASVNRAVTSVRMLAADSPQSPSRGTRRVSIVSEDVSFESSRAASPLLREDSRFADLPSIRSVSGHTLEELRQMIERDESFITSNRLRILRQDLVEKQESLARMKEELKDLLAQYEAQRRQKEADIANKESAADKLAKIASLRGIAEKFQQRRKSRSGEDPSAAEGGVLSDEDVLRLAREAKEQQKETTDRLFRGSGRRRTMEDTSAWNVFDEEGNDGDHASDGGTDAPPLVPPSSLLERRLQLTSCDAPHLKALRRFCSPALWASSSTTFTSHLRDVVLTTVVSVVDTNRREAPYLAVERCGAADTFSANDTVVCDSTTQSPLLFVDEWFSMGESDDTMLAKDNSFLLINHLNHMEPFTVLRCTRGDDTGIDDAADEDVVLRELLLQCSFTEESVCALFDVSCGMLQRVQMDDKHYEGFPQGRGGAMLESTGLTHPVLQDLYQALGAPPSTAQLARHLRSLKDGSKMKGGTAGSPNKQFRFQPSNLGGEPQRQTVRFARELLRKVARMARKPPADACTRVKVAVDTARPAEICINVTTSGEANSGALLGEVVEEELLNSEPHDDADGGMLEPSPASATLLAAPDSTTLSGDAAESTRQLSPWTEGSSTFSPSGTWNSSANRPAIGDDDDDEDSVANNSDNSSGSEEDVDHDESCGHMAELDSEAVITSVGYPQKRRKKRRSKSTRRGSMVAEPDPQHGADKDMQTGRPLRKASFRDHLRQSLSDAASRRKEPVAAFMGCLAEVVVPDVELMVPDSSATHPSVTQAWWQSRLLMFGLLRYFSARSILSYRSAWLFCRRRCRKEMAVVISAQRSQRAPSELSAAFDRIIQLYSRRFVFEDDDTSPLSKPVLPFDDVQPPSEDAAGKDVSDAASSERGEGESLTSCTIPVLDHTVRPHDDASAAAACFEVPSLPVVETERPLSDSPATPVAACMPQPESREKKYLQNAVPTPFKHWTKAEQDVSHYIEVSYHAHTALVHTALEDVASHVLRGFGTIRGAVQLRPRDCLRLCDLQCMQRVQECVLQRARETFDSDSQKMDTFIADMGRVALSFFVLGPLFEARTVMCVAGIVSFDAERFVSPTPPSNDKPLRLSGALQDAVEIVSFVERRAFSRPTVGRGYASSAECVSEAEDAAHRDPVNSSVGSGTRVFRELQPYHVRMLRVVEPLLLLDNRVPLPGSTASATSDAEVMDATLTAAAHGFFFEHDEVELMVHGIAFLCRILSSDAWFVSLSHPTLAGNCHCVAAARLAATAKALGQEVRFATDTDPNREERRQVHNTIVLSALRESIAAIQEAAKEWEALVDRGKGSPPSQPSGEHSGRPSNTHRDRRVSFADAETAEASDGNEWNHEEQVERVERCRWIRKIAESLNLALCSLCARVEMRVLAVLPFPIGDPLGGSSTLLHRWLSESHSVAQLRVQEELRSRQRKFYHGFFQIVADASVHEKRFLFQAVGVDPPTAPMTLEELVRQSMVTCHEEFDASFLRTLDSTQSDSHRSVAKNPLDYLKHPSRLANMNMNRYVMEQLREAIESENQQQFDSGPGTADSATRDGDPHMHGNSQLAGSPSSPFKNRTQRGSIMMEQLMIRAQQASTNAGSVSAADHLSLAAADGADERLASGSGRRPSVSPRHGVVTTEKTQFNKSWMSGSLTSHSATITSNQVAQHPIAQIQRMRLAIQSHVGDGIGGGEGLLSPLKAAALADAACRELSHLAASRRKLRDDGINDGSLSPKTPKLKNMQLGFPGESESTEAEKAQRNAAAYERALRQRSNRIKEMTDKEASAFQKSLLARQAKQRTSVVGDDHGRRHRPLSPSVQLALIDATGLLTDSERQPREFFVPVMVVAYQMMAFSDRTRTELHDAIPPQWVESGGVLMILSLARRELMPIVTGALFYDAKGTVEIDSTRPETLAPYFQRWTPPPRADDETSVRDAMGGAIFTPNESLREGPAVATSDGSRPYTADQSIPWVDCSIELSRGIMTLTSSLGTYRMSIRVLELLLAAMDAPNIHVPLGDPMHVVMFDNQQESGGVTHRSAEEKFSTSQRALRRLLEQRDRDKLVRGLHDKEALAVVADATQYREMLRQFFMPSHTAVGSRISFSPSRATDDRDDDEDHSCSRIVSLLRCALEALHDESQPSGCVSRSGDDLALQGFVNLRMTSGTVVGALPKSRSLLPPLGPLTHVIPTDEPTAVERDPTKAKLPPIRTSAATSASNTIGGRESLLVRSDVQSAPVADPRHSAAVPTVRVVTKWSQLLPSVATQVSKR